jgi:glycosyltransferase involved in cell wall biosynthesis
MRIAYPVDWSVPDRGAAIEQTLATASALTRHGAEVTVLAPRRPGDPRFTAESLGQAAGHPAEFELVQRDSPHVGPAIAPSALWFLRVARDPVIDQADAVLTRIPAVLGLGRRLPRPFAFDHYRPWPDRWPIARPLMKATLSDRSCLGVITHSAYAAGSYRRLGLPQAKLLVAHNGYDPARLGPDPGQAQARDRLGLPPGPLAVYAGRINATKGLGEVLAMARLRPGVRVLLVGSEGEGEVEQAARALANVGVVGWQGPEALGLYLRAADVLLIPPSRAPLERFGNCVLPLKTFQYLAAGRAILAPRAPDTAELLVDGETALLTEPSPQAAAEGLDRLIADTPLRDRLAGAARARAEHLTWDHRAERLLEFLRERLAA